MRFNHVWSHEVREYWVRECWVGMVGSVVSIKSVVVVVGLWKEHAQIRHHWCVLRHRLGYEFEKIRQIVRFIFTSHIGLQLHPKMLFVQQIRKRVYLSIQVPIGIISDTIIVAIVVAAKRPSECIGPDSQADQEENSDRLHGWGVLRVNCQWWQCGDGQGSALYMGSGCHGFETSLPAAITEKRVVMAGHYKFKVENRIRKLHKNAHSLTTEIIEGWPNDGLYWNNISKCIFMSKNIVFWYKNWYQYWVFCGLINDLRS